MTWTRSVLRLGHGTRARQVEDGADQDRLAADAPDADGDDADGEHEMLHHRVHDRQDRDRAERGDESPGPDAGRRGSRAALSGD